MLRTFEFLNTSQTLPLVVNTPSSSQASSRITATCDCPNQCRTLWDIVWSCLFTMFLCTWVSIHPNIPSPHEGWVRVTSRRLGVMLAVLIAPELIFSWALRQRILARRLANEHRGELVEHQEYPMILSDCSAWMDCDAWLLCHYGGFYGF